MNEKLTKLLHDIRHEHHLKLNDQNIDETKKLAEIRQKEEKIKIATSATYEIIANLPPYNTFEVVAIDNEHEDPEGSKLRYWIELRNEDKMHRFTIKKIGYISLHGFYGDEGPVFLNTQYQEAYQVFYKDHERILKELLEGLKKR